MALRSSVLLVTNEPETVSAVSGALDSNEQFELTGVCEGLPALVGRLEVSHAAAVLVDIDPAPERLLEGLAAIVARFAETRFVVLASALRNELVIEAMQIGARHFLIKRSIGVEILSVLQRLIPNGFSAAPGQGTVVTVLSASGGCGATTLAFNIANELGLEASEAALLVDLDSCYGAAAPYLGLKAEYGIADVLSYDGQIDGHLIESSAVAYSDALHALLSPIAISFSEPLPLRFESLGAALEAFKCAYSHTVVDAPRVPMAVAAVLASHSEAALVVFQLTVKDIHLVRSIQSALIERGVAPDLIVPLANRCNSRSPISLKEAQKALGGTKIVQVRNDFRSAVRSINLGQPLAQAARRSGLRRDIRRLATEVALKTGPRSQTRRE